MSIDGSFLLTMGSLVRGPSEHAATASSIMMH